MASTANQEWNPDDEEFIAEVVYAGGVLFSIGVAVLTAFFIYYAVRCVCWTCLGDECCDKRNKVRASQDMVKWNNYAITALLIGCVAGGIWLLYASFPIIDSLDSLTSKLVEEANAFQTSANTTITVIEDVVGEDENIDLSELREAQTLLAQAEEDLKSGEEAVREATDSFGGIIIFIGVLAIICAVLGILCVFVRSIIFLYVYFIIATFTVFALWALAGFAFVGNKAFEETCQMMELHAAGDQNQFVIDNLPCDDLAQVGDAVSEAQIGANTAVQDGNADITALNTQAAPLAQGTFNEIPLLCEPFVEETAGSNVYVANTNATDCVQMAEDAVEESYSPLVCPEEITGEIPGDAAWQQCALFNDPAQPIPNSTFTELLEKAATVQVINNQLPTIRSIASCGFIDEAFETIVEDECKPLEQDSYNLATASLISAIALTITSFYFCICIQNIRKQDAPEAWPGEEEQYVEGKV